MSAPAFLARLPDWQPRLRRYLRSVDGLPVQPGAHDCCLFAAGAVEAVTGLDYAAPWRGRYSTWAGGWRILRKARYADHRALLVALLPELPLARALPGDIVLLAGEAGMDACGVVQGAAAYVLTDSARLGLVPLAPGQRLFAVGAR